VGFAIRGGTVHSVIGPNGAGKTTLFNLITGIYTPSSGEIEFDGESVAGRTPSEFARRGMSRTFQNLQVCMNMSAIENVMVGAHLRLNQSLFAGMLHLPALRSADHSCRDEAAQLMEFVGVGKYVKAHAGSMPYGALKRMEIARALAAKPKMVLLDEPAAVERYRDPRNRDAYPENCVNRRDSRLGRARYEARDEPSDHILVLDYGKKLAEGRRRKCAPTRM